MQAGPCLAGCMAGSTCRWRGTGNSLQGNASKCVHEQQLCRLRKCELQNCLTRLAVVIPVTGLHAYAVMQ